MSEPITMIPKADGPLPPLDPDFELTPPAGADGTDLFLLAWKRGIFLCGRPSWFGGSDPIYLSHVRNKDLLQPRVKDIAKAINTIPLSQACLVAGMVGFYNPAEGARLASRIDANGIGDIVRPLNREQRLALALMAMNYQGW